MDLGRDLCSSRAGTEQVRQWTPSTAENGPEFLTERQKGEFHGTGCAALRRPFCVHRPGIAVEKAVEKAKRFVIRC